MMTLMEAVGIGKVVLLAMALALALATIGCATGPLGSHGVAYIPAFEAPPPGGG